MAQQQVSLPLHFRLLFFYLKSLESHPVTTKAITSAYLNALQELTALTLTSSSQKSTFYSLFKIAKSKKARKSILWMAVYGGAISAPLSHFLYAGLTKLFENRKGPLMTAAQIALANFVIIPIQTCVYIMAMAVIAGKDVREAVRTQLASMCKQTWVVFPVVQWSASKFLPPPMWVPYFSFLNYIFSVYLNVSMKRKRLE